MDTPPPHTVGGANTQVDPWAYVIDMLCQKLKDDELEKVIWMMDDDSMTDDDDADDDDDKMMKMETDRPVEVEQPQQKFRRIMSTANAERLPKALEDLDYHEEGKKLSEWVKEFIEKYRPAHDLNVNEIFIGREEEVEEICDMLRGECDKFKSVKCVSLCGIGGQGKTTVARHVCHKLNWNTYGFDMRDKTKVSDLMKAILLEEGKEVPADSDDILMEELKDFMNSIKESTLIYVDDCDGIMREDFRQFYNFLREILNFIDDKSSGVRFLLTTREKIEEVKSLEVNRNEKLLIQRELESLKKYDAIDLLCKTSGLEIEPTPAEEIVNECACSPLAIGAVADMLKQEKFTVQRLLLHLKMDKKNVTKALLIDRCIDLAVVNLQEDLTESLVRLSVFQASSFDEKSAEAVCQKKFCAVRGGTDGSSANEGNTRNSITHIQALCNAHLITVVDNYCSDKLYSLHPLVYKYLQEWRQKPRHLVEAFNDATKKFMKLYEDKISHMVLHMDKKYLKAMKELELHRNNIMNFYHIMDSKKALLEPYKKKSGEKEFLKKKRMSDLGDLLLPDVQKRRIFKSEATRAKDSGNDGMQIFWTVEEADVYVMLCDKPTIAQQLLDGLSQGRFPALQGLQDRSFYPHLVHALFHKVKGLTYWKLQQHERGLEHLQLTLKFFEHLNNGHLNPPIGERRLNVNYVNLHSRIYFYMGHINIELGRYEMAEAAFNIGFEMVKSNIAGRDEKKSLQWDIPRYLGSFGLICLRKAQKEQDQKVREKLLDEAHDRLRDAMEKDRRLKLDQLDGYCMKMKTKADVFIEQRKFDAALHEAEAALHQRRAILQPPHIKYTESVHQVAKIYLLKGNEILEKGDRDEAKKYWRTSWDYFTEMEEHHLVNGSINRDHPLYPEIKQDYFEVTRLYHGEHSKAVEKLKTFYVKLERGDFNARAESHFTSFKKMLQTPKEFLQTAFGLGGNEFGDRNVQFQEVDARDQLEQMIDGRYGVDRRDSGHSSMSYDGSTSSTGSGSLSHGMGRLHLEKSVSLEDNVFGSSDTHNVRDRKSSKRQKTNSEDPEPM